MTPERLALIKELLDANGRYTDYRKLALELHEAYLNVDTDFYNYKQCY